MHRGILLVFALSLFVSACGGTETATEVQLVAPAEAADVIADQPAGLVVLDIRTPQEFAGGTLPNAINVDFYAADFRAQLETLDKDVPYVMYCNSGNRSASAADLMEELGFGEVYEIDGGIQAWAQSGGALTLP